jgi:hypothetical protein
LWYQIDRRIDLRINMQLSIQIPMVHTRGKPMAGGLTSTLKPGAHRPSTFDDRKQGASSFSSQPVLPT